MLGFAFRSNTLLSELRVGADADQSLVRFFTENYCVEVLPETSAIKPTPTKDRVAT